jgi:competence protein ComEC
VGGWALALAAAGFWSGILWATGGERNLGAGTGLILVLAGLPFLALTWLVWSTRGSPTTVVGVVLGVFVAFAFVGAGWGAMHDARVRSSPVAALGGRGAEVIGAISSIPEEGTFGWTGAIQTKVVFPVGGGSSAIRSASLVWLEGRGRPPRLPWGEQVEVEGTIAALRGSFGSYLRRRGYAARLEVDAIRDRGPPSNPLRRAANSLRSSLRRSLSRIFPRKEAGLLMGLALGDTSGLDPGVEEDFRATGLSHLTAVSGENLVLFLAPILGATGFLGAGRRARFAIGVGAVGFFVLLTGAEPSVLRAAAMSGLTLLGLFLGRPRSPPAILGGAALLLLAHDPTLVHSVGFQLSVAATVGMALLAQPLATRMSSLPRPLAVAAGTTLAAQFGVMPLLLFYFQVFPLVSFPANLLAFPAVGPGMLLGLVAGGLEAVWHPVAIVVASVARFPIGYLQWLAHNLVRSPVPSITSHGGQLATLLLGLAALGIAGWWVRSGRRIPRRVVLVGALVLPALVLTSAFRSGTPSRLTIVFFDVGQGDSALIRSPAGAAILIDGGPDPDLVAARLAALGVRRLDLMVATHAHADHVAGLPTVLARFQVALVIDPGCGGDSPYYSEFLRAIRSSGVPFRHPPARTFLRVGDVRLDVLGPEACHDGTESDANNDSLVLRVSAGPASVMFSGDAEQPAQTEMLQDTPEMLRALVLKVPHHGGATSLREFFRAIHGTVAVVSVGPNRYGHPVRDVLQMLAADGMRVFRTDRTGDLRVSFEDGRVLVSSGG